MIAAIGSGPEKFRLLDLDLASNSLGPGSGKALAEALRRNKTLTRLSLRCALVPLVDRPALLLPRTAACRRFIKVDVDTACGSCYSLSQRPVYALIIYQPSGGCQSRHLSVYSALPSYYRCMLRKWARVAL